MSNMQDRTRRLRGTLRGTLRGGLVAAACFTGVAGVAGVPGVAYAEGDPVSAPVPDGPTVVRPGLGANLDPHFAFLAAAMSSEKIVKGAPYSAQGISEYHQLLGDGNRIDRSRTTLLYRDSEGRTRQEMSGPHTLIYVNDPLAGRRYLLDPERKTAVLFAGDTPAAAGDHKPAGVFATLGGVMHRAWGKLANASGLAGPDAGAPQGAPPGPPPGPPPGGPPGPPHHGPDAPPGEGHSPEGMPPGGPGASPPPMPFVLREPRGPGVMTPLGSKDFETLHAEGTRTTWTIPAGQLGNERPLVMTSDQWYAPDLLLTVYSRDYDPRDGETVYQIRDIKRSEPSPELFTVPSDYTVITAPHLPQLAGAPAPH